MTADGSNRGIAVGDTVRFRMAGGDDATATRGKVVYVEGGATVVRWTCSPWIYVYAADRLTVVGGA